MLEFDAVLAVAVAVAVVVAVAVAVAVAVTDAVVLAGAVVVTGALDDEAKGWVVIIGTAFVTTVFVGALTGLL